MRNILVLPNGEEIDFMYPPNREITVGTQFEATFMDGSSHLFQITEIVREEKRILYKVSY